MANVEKQEQIDGFTEGFEVEQGNKHIIFKAVRVKEEVFDSIDDAIAQKKRGSIKETIKYYSFLGLGMAGVTGGIRLMLESKNGLQAAAGAVSTLLGVGLVMGSFDSASKAYQLGKEVKKLKSMIQRPH
jgi:hypothetical protein